MTSLANPRWLRAADARLEDLRAILDQRTDPDACPNAARLLHDVPVYDSAALRPRLRDEEAFPQILMSEWADIWENGPGILVLQGALAAPVVDDVTARFVEIIERERDGGSRGDHFAKAGANDRVWNALEKLCLLDPAAFARYYANDMLALASEAWLGPAYQMTSQVNNVRPGGTAQTPHRDFHLGFCSADQAQRYPSHAHRLSPMLTLQGAVAHVDMPLESGPTLYLPHSQKYRHGYLVADRDEFRRHFSEHRVQLPLSKGDAVFFNPALLHAAGENRSRDIQRMANLLQVSSAFGRAMESVNRDRMLRMLYPQLLAMGRDGALDRRAQAHVVAASAEGYAFPTNLDRDPPLGGLAPESPQAVTLRALHEGWPPERLFAWLDEAGMKRLT
ncbi:phytanoyl-CoA dioxygenase family protein [Scleromatobacter humisilvae]|uniref:Phytanoyl-CoA dioxygenase family protein n=1 Tax=Scleromatobacter humisilvae TaxID=2897159 RepID=A0A9X2C4D8_9BURK|nr:phytanoyl-CoA dioxygenase family protein [Scleromatobacter humisilvae]MCK9689270.1 phytanoyl-CoA dioxygenase family protein [Scleromatobacter humisilvae]